MQGEATPHGDPGGQTFKSVPINADATCPAEIEWTGGERPVEYKTNNIKTHTGVMEEDKYEKGSWTFTCDVEGVPDADIMEAVDKCAYDFMHKDGCEDSNPHDENDECLYDLYKECYIHASDPLNALAVVPAVETCEEGRNQMSDRALEIATDCQGEVCMGSPGKFGTAWFPIIFSERQDTFAAPVNVRHNVDPNKPPQVITECTANWGTELMPDDSQWHPCIVVRYDIDSMRAYSKDGFGPNYCTQNDGNWEDGLQMGCFWGGVVGSIVVTVVAGPGAPLMGGVIVPMTVGGAGVACEKLLNMKNKWPHSQY